jgi:hypothetical protein
MLKKSEMRVERSYREEKKHMQDAASGHGTRRKVKKDPNRIFCEQLTSILMCQIYV